MAFVDRVFGRLKSGRKNANPLKKAASMGFVITGATARASAFLKRRLPPKRHVNKSLLKMEVMAMRISVCWQRVSEIVYLMSYHYKVADSLPMDQILLVIYS